MLFQNRILFVLLCLLFLSATNASAGESSERKEPGDAKQQERMAASYFDTVCTFLEIVERNCIADAEGREEEELQLPYVFDSYRRLLRPSKPVLRMQDDLVGDYRVVLAHQVSFADVEQGGRMCVLRRYLAMPVQYDLSIGDAGEKPRSALPRMIKPLSVTPVKDSDLVKVTYGEDSVELAPGQSWRPVDNASYVPFPPGEVERAVTQVEIRYWGTVRYVARPPLRTDELEKRVSELVQLLGTDASRAMRSAASMELIDLGEEAGDELTRALESEDPTKVLAALRVLREVYCAKSVPRMISLLNSPHVELRLAAAWTLGKLEAKSAVPGLLKLLKEQGEPNVVCAALAALREIGDREVLPVLKESVEGHPDSRVRLVALGTMATLGTSVKDDLVLTELESSDREVQDAAIRALGFMGTDAAIERLNKLERSSENPAVRIVAHLARLGAELRRQPSVDKSIDLLRIELSSRDQETKTWAAAELAKIGTDQALRATRREAGLSPRYARQLLGEISRADRKARAKAALD